MSITAVTQDVEHRLRTSTHQAAAFVDHKLKGCTPEQRFELRQFISAIAECADDLRDAGGVAVKLPASLVRAGFGI